MKDVIMKDVENFMIVFNKAVNETPVCELTIINRLISNSDYIINVDLEYDDIPNRNFKNDCLYHTEINIKLLTKHGYHSFKVDKIFKRYSLKSGIVSIKMKG